jgi:hypothetical protein
LRWPRVLATVAPHNNNGARHMAVDTSKGNPNMDYAEHTSTYNGFLKLTQYGIVFLVLLLVAMFMFLVPAPH